MMWWNKTKTTSISISCNFFESYHGHNACDGATSHIKKTLTQHEKNNNKILTNIKDINTVINNINNHSYNIFCIKKNSFAPKFSIKFKDISKCYMFTFNSDGYIFGYEDSKNKKLLKEYSLHSINKLYYD